VASLSADISTARPSSAPPLISIIRLRAAASHEEASILMRQRAEDYLPACLEALAVYVSPEHGMEVRILKSAELRARMVVDQDVRAKNGLLLLAKAQEVTPSVLVRLRAFATKVGIAEPIRVLADKSA
jgi:hypothetical protein